MSQKNYWDAVEEQWRGKHLQSLERHLDCTCRAHEWIAKLATHGDIVETPVSEVLGVSRLLLRRLGEELRAVEILAIEGHGFQSAAAACNLFEQSHYLTYVGISPDNARRFDQWKHPERCMLNVKELVKASGAARGWPQTRCDEEYEKYSFLCGFKHNNPCFQRLLRLPTDPDLYISQYSLAESIWSCVTAVELFAVQFLDAKHLNGFLEEVNPIMDEAKNLFPLLP